MSDGEYGSRSDLEALRQSGRGKFIAMAVLIVAMLGAAGWYFFGRKHGTGNAEDPAKVIVVSNRVGLSLGLTEAGFEAVEGSFDAWVRKAQEDVPDLEVDGIEAIFALADRFGYGFVVFDGPQEVDFSKLDIEDDVPTFPEHVRFAVLSVGDFAFPHVLTVNPEPSKVVRGASLMLLQALFAQPQLEAALKKDAGAGVEAIQLHDRLREGIERLARVPEGEALAEKRILEVRATLSEEERAEPKPRLWSEPLEVMGPVPLANGNVLGVVRGFQMVARGSAGALDLDLEPHEDLVFAKATDEPSARAVCTVFNGGQIPTTESPRYAYGDDGDAVVLQTLADGAVLYVHDAADTGCGLRKAGPVPAAGAGIDEAVVPHGSGKVARVGGGSLEIVSVPGDAATMFMLDDVSLSDPSWLDGRYLAAVASPNEYGAEGDRLVLFDLETPTQVLTIPASVFDGADSIGEVARGRLGDKPVLVVAAGRSPRRVYRLALPAALPDLFAQPPTAASTRTRDGVTNVVGLEPSRLTARALTHEGWASELAVSPDGTRVAFVLADSTLDDLHPEDGEIAMVEVDREQGGLRLLTRNALRDLSPRFTADGKHVVLRTRVEIPKTDWTLTAARVVDLGE